MEHHNTRRRYTWIKIILFAFLILLIVRCVVESFRMTSTQMENSIRAGDFIFVDKTAYGIRLPVTPLSIPFFPDSIPLLMTKTYSKQIQLPYTRLFEKKVTRNDVVVFNIPESSGYTPLDKRVVSISRCIGEPGDTIEVRNDNYYINGKKITQSADLISVYEYPKESEAVITEAIRKLFIPYRGIYGSDSLNAVSLSRYEFYLLQDQLTGKNIRMRVSGIHDLNYILAIPEKGMKIALTPEHIMAYKQIIEQENNHLRLKDGQFYTPGTEKRMEHYIFKNDYYWLLSDNPDVSSDSRHFGFISHPHIIGKARIIWMSKDTGKNLFSGYRWNRFFLSII